MIAKFLYNINYGFNGWPKGTRSQSATGGSPHFGLGVSIEACYRRTVIGDGNGWGAGPTSRIGDGKPPR